MSMPIMRGFHTDRVTAWWVACDQCSDSELVTGSTADSDALQWASAHLHDVHGGVVIARAEVS